VAEKAVAKRFGSVKAAKSALKGNRANGALRRLKPDETLKVRFLEEPDDWFEAHYHWLGGNFLWCSQDKSCAGCKAGDRPKTIVLANAVIFNSEDDREQNKVVVMQMAPTLANTLLKFHEKRKTITDRDYDLTREGSGVNDTVYSADPDDPRPRKMSRFANDLHDIEAIIASEIGGGDGEEDEEDDEPRSTKKPAKKSSRRSDEEDDEYEDEEEDEDEEEEEQDDFSDLDRAELKQAIKKLEPDFVAKKSQSDEDLRAYLWDLNYAEDEEDEDEEDERPMKSKKSKSSGIDEFKKKPAAAKPKGRAVVRRAR